MTDPVIRGLPPVGAADQFMDSTDALADLRYPRAVVNAFRGTLGHVSPVGILVPANHRETKLLPDRDRPILGDLDTPA
jgi:hypothetical protein